MADSKGETSGEATGLHKVVDAGERGSFYTDATAEDVAAALLANPEARMAVLERMPEFDAESHVVRMAFSVEATDREAEMRHLQDAAELLRKVHRDGGMPWLEALAWSKRDQALSAPTAESGKDHSASAQKETDDDRKRNDRGATAEQRETGDAGLVRGEADSPRDDRRAEGSTEESGARAGDHEAGGSATLGRRGDDGRVAHYCIKCGAVDGQCTLRGCLTESERAEPAPVAEAPERVTCQICIRNVAAHLCAKCFSRLCDGDTNQIEVCKKLPGYRAPASEKAPPESAIAGAVAFLLDAWRANDGAEGESVRLVCKALEQLEREVVELRKEMETERDGHALTAHAVWDEKRTSDSLRAKLSEAERELVDVLTGLDYERRARAAESAFDDDACNCAPNHMHDCPAYRSPAAQEPTGGEPAKPDPHGPSEWLTPEERAATSPAAEAEPRFSGYHDQPCAECGKMYDAHGSDESCPIADPAPPRPGWADEAERALDRFLKEPHSPSEDALYDAIRWVLAGVRDELEREGSEKP